MNTDATTCTESIHRTVSAGSVRCVTNTENRLVSRLKSGQDEAFTAMVTQQHGALIRMALGYVANREAAEEVVQESWMAVFKGLNRFEGRSSLYPWIRAILIHKAKDRGVREKRYTIFSDFEFQGEGYHGTFDSSRFRRSGEWASRWAFSPQTWDDRTPEQLLASKQAIACMQQAIQALPALLKEVLILRDAHGVETQEVCKRLNISEANLYVRLHRAREQVRVAVETALG